MSGRNSTMRETERKTAENFFLPVHFLLPTFVCVETAWLSLMENENKVQ